MKPTTKATPAICQARGESICWAVLIIEMMLHGSCRRRYAAIQSRSDADDNPIRAWLSMPLSCGPANNFNQPQQRDYQAFLDMAGGEFRDAMRRESDRRRCCL